MKEEITKLMILYCDNTSVINISKNPMIHPRTKHITIKYGGRQTSEDGIVNSKEKIAYIFIKKLPKYAFKYLRGKLGVITLPKAI